MTFFMMRLFLLLVLGIPQNAATERPDGAHMFQTVCYSCHHPGSGYPAPSLEQLHQMTRGSILRSLESGRMREQSAGLTPEERGAVTDFLGAPDPITSGPPAGTCAARDFSIAGDPSWSGWGADLTNSRFQPAGKAGLGRDAVT